MWSEGYFQINNIGLLMVIFQCKDWLYCTMNKWRFCQHYTGQKLYIFNNILCTCKHCYCNTTCIIHVMLSFCYIVIDMINIYLCLLYCKLLSYFKLGMLSFCVIYHYSLIKLCVHYITKLVVRQIFL